VIIASLIGLFLAGYFPRIIHFFPPVVTGCVIRIIRLSLLPVVFRWMMDGNKNAPEPGSVENIGLALGIVLCLNLTKNASIHR